jgi:hypothetical protein
MNCPRCQASMAGNVSFGAYLGLLAALVACGAIVVPAIQSMQGGTSAR